MNSSLHRTMTEEQQAAIYRYTRIGLRWISGKISTDDVIKDFGNPEFNSDQLGGIEYAWYPGNVMKVMLLLKNKSINEGSGQVVSFEISVENDVLTNIPYQNFDDLGLSRLVRGEKIDGARIEAGDFYNPSGVVDPVGSLPLNLTTFAYRLPLPDDSPYDIYAGFDYLADLVSEHGPWNLGNIRKAVNLRELSIYSHYLTPEELDERKRANRWTTP